MQRNTRNMLIAGSVAVAVLLGSGLATYLLGGDGTVTEDVPRVDLDKRPLRSYEPTEKFRLNWGKGPRDVWVDEHFFGATLDTFSVDDRGRILIADHPEWHVGARVRRFAADGRLERTWLTPAGSIFFEFFGNGIMYVTASGGGPSESVWLVSEDRSTVASFPVPPKLNSTSLFRTGDVLVVTTEVAELASDPDRTRIRPMAVPVVLLTKEGPEPAPVQTAEAGAGPETTGGMYKRLVEANGWFVSADSTQTITLSDGRAVRIPGLAAPLGVDGDTVWMQMRVAKAPETHVERPGWPMGLANEVEVIAGRVDGRFEARVIAPWSPYLLDAKRRFLVTKGAFWALTADRRGVSLLKYGPVER